MRCAVRQHAKPRAHRTRVFPRLLPRAAQSHGARHRRYLFAIFAHHPLWMKLLLIVRNKVAALAGLEAPTTSEILHIETKDRYVVGEKIGVWPIFSISENEVVAGRNNKHMDFRLSVLKVRNDHGTSVVVSTICTVHNL